MLECARANGDIVSARKGVTDYVALFRGRAAHAGVEPEKGRHAVLAAAHATVALQALNGRWPGVTVNVGVAGAGRARTSFRSAAGSRSTCARPRPTALEAAEAEIAAICASTAVEGVRSTPIGGHGHRPMEKGDAAHRLVDRAVAIAGELGFALEDAATGGASDGNTTSAAGTPTLDGLGPIGGDAHADDEWLDLGSVVPRDLARWPD